MCPHVTMWIMKAIKKVLHLITFINVGCQGCLVLARRVWDFQGTLPVWVQPHLWWLHTFQKLSPSYHQHLLVKQISIYDIKCFTTNPTIDHKMLCNISLVSSGSDVCSSTCTDWHVKVERFGKICKSQRLHKCFVASLLICNPMAAENTSGQIKVERRLTKVFSLPTLLCETTWRKGGRQITVFVRTTSYWQTQHQLTNRWKWWN